MSASSSKSTGLAQRYLAAIKNNDDSIHSSGVGSSGALEFKGKHSRSHSESTKNDLNLLPIPNEDHLEEEPIQSRNGSTSPSRLRPNRFPLNNTRDDTGANLNEVAGVGVEAESKFKEMSRNDDRGIIRKWARPQWQNSRQTNAERGCETQESDVQRGRRIDTASPVLTDVSDPVTEITNNRSTAPIASGLRTGKRADQDLDAVKAVDANTTHNKTSKPWQRKSAKSFSDQGWIKSTPTHMTKNESEPKDVRQSPLRVKSPSSFSNINQDPVENDTVEAPSFPQHKSLSYNKESFVRSSVNNIAGKGGNVEVPEKSKTMWGNFHLRPVSNRISKHTQNEVVDTKDNADAKKANVFHGDMRKVQQSFYKDKGSAKMIGEEDQDDTTCTNTCTASTSEPVAPNAILNSNESADLLDNGAGFISVKTRLRSWNQSGKNYQYFRSSSSTSPVRDKISVPPVSQDPAVTSESKEQRLQDEKNDLERDDMNPAGRKSHFRRSTTPMSTQQVVKPSTFASPKRNPINHEQTQHDDIPKEIAEPKIGRQGGPKKSLQDRINAFGGVQVSKPILNEKRVLSKNGASEVQVTKHERESPTNLYSKTKLLKSVRRVTHVSAESGVASPDGVYSKAKLKSWKPSPKTDHLGFAGEKTKDSEPGFSICQRQTDMIDPVSHANNGDVSVGDQPAFADKEQNCALMNHSEGDKPQLSLAVKGMRARFESSSVNKTSLSTSPRRRLKSRPDSIHKKDNGWIRPSKSPCRQANIESRSTFRHPSVSRSPVRKEDINSKSKEEMKNTDLRGSAISPASCEILPEPKPLTFKSTRGSGAFQGLRSKFEVVSKVNKCDPTSNTSIARVSDSRFEDESSPSQKKKSIEGNESPIPCPPKPQENSLKIGSEKNSAFQRIRSDFECGRNHSKSPSPKTPINLPLPPKPEDVPVDIADNPSRRLSFSLKENIQDQNPLPSGDKQNPLPSGDKQRISAFTSYKSCGSAIPSIKPIDSCANVSIDEPIAQAPSNDIPWNAEEARINSSPDGSIVHIQSKEVPILQTQSNDIPWKITEPNDIPWNDRELMEERERSFYSQRAVHMSYNAGVNMSYSGEFMDYSFEDDDCDGVTLCPSASDVSSLSIPFGLQSVGGSSAVSDSTQTSDEAIESVSEKQSTTVGPSEASSSQTSEAATPLIKSMSLRFGMATSSDTTGTMSYGNHFTKLLETLPPPLDVEEKDEENDDSTYKPTKRDDYRRNKQFEEQLNITREPQWKSDFFAVDSVKSNPTVDSKEVSGWTAFHDEPSRKSEDKIVISETSKVSIDKTDVSSPPLGSQSPSAINAKLSDYPIQQRSIKDMSIHHKSTKSTSVSTSSSISPSTSLREKTKPDPVEAETSSPATLRPAVAYRRFNLQKVRAFQKARSSFRQGS